MQMSVSVWRLTGTTGDGVQRYAFVSRPQDPLRRVTKDVIFSSVKPGIKVNFITPRCTCEGHVSRDWYVRNTCFPDCFRCCRVVAGSGAFTTGMGVDGDRRSRSSSGKIHARGDALSDFASSMIWVGDCKTNFETFCTSVLMLSIQGWRCRPVARCVDPLPDGMVDLIFDPMHTR